MAMYELNVRPYIGFIFPIAYAYISKRPLIYHRPSYSVTPLQHWGMKNMSLFIFVTHGIVSLLVWGGGGGGGGGGTPTHYWFVGGVPLPTNLLKSELTFQKLAPQSISQSEALLQ